MSTLKVPASDDDHFQGSEEAPITIIQYGDYECPDCKKAHSIIKEIQTRFGSQLKIGFRNFPLQAKHPCAQVAAQVAEFSDSKNKFWEMHDLIYENQERLGMPLLLELTQKLELPVKELEEALENETFMPRIQKNFVGGIKSSVNRLPTLFINGERYNGNLDLEELVEHIEKLL
ncbi:MAG TPA: thioredoxin domain-containing protein [Parachlamydiaceae bacterium]|nr:thioredoxin domain-containing protein [Parachlamydiaceae bacterium]